jgi:hypothetical protein
VAVGATEHVLLLGDRSFHIRPARDIRIRHVENGEALAVFGGQSAGHLSPIAWKDLDMQASMWHRCISPAFKIAGRLSVVGVGRIGSLESLEGLTQDSTPAKTFLADEPAGFCFVVATEWASWHSLFSNQAGPGGAVSPV